MERPHPEARPEPARGEEDGVHLLSEAGDLDPDRVTTALGAGEQPLERRDVAVVAGPPDGDGPGAGVDRVGRIEAVPAAVPPLDPGMALAGDRLADGGVRLGVQISRDVARRQPEP